jgi:hypothetical protein
MTAQVLPTIDGTLILNDTTTIKGQCVSILADTATLKAAEILDDRHVANIEYFYGKAAVGNLADNTSYSPWTCTAGAGGVYGAAVQLDDGTKIGGGLATSSYRLTSVTASNPSFAGATYKIRFLTGAAIGTAVALCETQIVVPAAGDSLWVPLPLRAYRTICNQKLWAKIICSHDAATLDFVVGLVLYNTVPSAFIDCGP